MTLKNEILLTIKGEKGGLLKHHFHCNFASGEKMRMNNPDEDDSPCLPKYFDSPRSCRSLLVISETKDLLCALQNHGEI